MTNSGDVHWQWSRFEALNVDEFYEIMVLRQRVFVVEQKCFYLDADGLDRVAWHLCGSGAALLAYLRVLPPGTRYASDASIGRVLTAPEARGTGLGKLVVAEGLTRIRSQFGAACPIRIEAQAYLDKFYAEFGFRAVGEPYLLDGISHLEMVAD